MDIQLQGFECHPSQTKLSLFLDGNDKWLCKRKLGYGFEVTLVSLEDGSTGPLNVWVTNATKDEETFYPGQTVVIKKSTAYYPCIYYPKDNQQRMQFDKYNLFYVYFIDRMKISPLKSSFKFNCENNGIEVNHKTDKEREGKIKVFGWNLGWDYELQTNKPNTVHSDQMGHCVFLENKEEVEPIDNEEELQGADEEDFSLQMDVELQGFRCDSAQEEQTLSREGNDKWLCVKKDPRYEITLASLEDGSPGPLDVWLTGATKGKATFHLGRAVVIERNTRHFPCLYYIKDPKQRNQFNRYNLVMMRIFPHMEASSNKSNLEFLWKNNWIHVKDKTDGGKRRIIKVLDYRLNRVHKLQVNRKNAVPRGEMAFKMYLEERREVKKSLQTSGASLDTYKMASQLSSYLKDIRNCDIKFIADDGRAVGTHRLLVEARTTLLKEKKKASSEMKMPSKGALADFAHFLIHDEVQNMQWNALELFELACKYDVKLLKDQCEEFFADMKVARDNEGQVERLASEYESRALLKALMRYKRERKEYSFDPPKSLAEDLAGDEKSEVVLISRDGREVRCPSVLLTCRSRIFKKRLQLELRKCPGEKATLEVSEYDASVLTQFVHFLKTDQVQDMRTHAAQLALMAYEYSVSKLGVDCIDYICNNLDQFTTSDLLRASKMIASSKLDSALEEKLEKI